MIETNISSIDTDALMKTIHEGVQKTSQLSSSFIAAELPSFTEDVVAPVKERALPLKDQYSIQDFSGFSNEEFIANACRVILQREPNSGEFFHILESLERGDLTKAEVLGIFRFSPEGKEKKVTIKGVLIPFMVRRMGRVPVVGKVVRICSCVYRLPMLVKNILQLNNNVAHLNTNVEAIQDRHVQGLRKIILSINDLEEKFTSWQQASAHQTDILLKGFAERQQAEFDDFLLAFEKLKQEAVTAVNQELDLRLPDIVTLQRRLRRFESQSKPAEQSSGVVTQNLQDQESGSCASFSGPVQLDSLYIAFENRFRGNPEDVYVRLQAYVPYIQKVSQAIPDGKALDVGCGRGEWLDVLKKEKIPAVGVDLNECMLEDARARGLNVVCEDLFVYLHDVTEKSFSIFSGFHIVEHLPFASLVLLIDEALRTLQDGGMVIFETPNPENLLTGACNFYLDPTHKNPIPPPLLEFLLKARGFSRVEILRLHPNDSVQLKEQVVQDMLFGPQDYAVLGWK